MLLLGLLFIYPFFLQFLIVNQTTSSSVGFDQDNLHTSKLISSDTIQWLNNTGFDSNQNWTSGWEIDETDANATISGGNANFTINGDIRTFSNVSGIPKNSSYEDGWTQINNTLIPTLPDDFGIDSEGIYVTHDYKDPQDPTQLSSVHWYRNITLDVDMSDYTITNVSLSVAINGSVETNSGENDPGVDVPGDTVMQNAQYDNARFYFLISDIDNTEVHEAAYYQTTSLGLESGPIADLDTTYLTIIANESLIYHLTSVLESDPDHKSFIITLGIRIACEDNFNYDWDKWNSLRFKSCNFSFTYEKNIDKLASISLNQFGNKISDLSSEYNVIVTDATFNFNYKLDQAWPTSLSPNSEIRVLINSHPHVETIKLSDANTTVSEIQLGGWDISSIITDDVNFSIQVFLSDEFLLNRSISILIDNVSLYISYDLVEVDPTPTPPIDWSPLVIGLILGIIALIIGFTSYQLYFRYPPMVRRIRALKRKVKKGKRTRPLMVRNRHAIVSTRMRNQMQILRIEPQLERSGMGAGKKQVIGLFITLFIFASPFVFQFLNIKMMNSSQGSPTQGYLRTSAEELGDREWLDNNIFDVQGQWYNTTEGDPTDVNANINNGAANFITEGETHAFSEISGIPQGSDWTKTPNPEYTAYPNDYSDIDPQGCRVEHYWHEDANQLPSVHWERNITMPHDMSNYIITSASITAIVNGSCDSTPSDGGSVGDRGIEAKGDSCANYSTGDYARFYIRISDTVKKKVYEIAWNQTSEYFGLDL